MSGDDNRLVESVEVFAGDVSTQVSRRQSGRYFVRHCRPGAIMFELENRAELECLHRALGRALQGEDTP